MPAVVLAAEKRLSGIPGPVASFIIGSAALDSTNAGELFARLAAEPNDQGELDYFLSIIELRKSENKTCNLCEVVVFG